MTDSAPDLKTLDPFAMPAPPPVGVVDEAQLDRIGAKNGFETAEVQSRERAAPVNKSERATKPKTKRSKAVSRRPAPEVRRMRTADATPKAQFNQRVPVSVANGFYDYQRETGVPMWKVLERAYEALLASEKRAGRSRK